MLIGDLAKHSGLSRDTIRWYEKVGLLQKEMASRGENNYRQYEADALDRLVLIKQSKSLGLSIHEIKELLFLIDSDDLQCKTVTPLIDDKIRIIEDKIEELQRMKSKLLTIREQCSGDCEQEIRNAE